jgi:HAD hydrolase, family IA, variant 3
MNKELNKMSSKAEVFATAQCGAREPLTLLFDFGGTLDTAGCHWGKFLWHAYERNAIPVTEGLFREAYVHAERTLGKQAIIQSTDTFLSMLTTKIRIEFDYLVRCGWIAVDKEEADRMQRSLVKDVYERVKANLSVSRSVLTELRKKYRIGLVTNFYGNMSVVLDEFGLASLFDTVTESAIVGVRKPDPQIFRLAVKALDVEGENVVVIGDSYSKDILPAHEIGCHTIWLKGEGWVTEELTTCEADYIIKDLYEVEPVLKQYMPL